MVLSVLFVNYLAKLPKIPALKKLLDSRIVAVLVNTQRVSYLTNPMVMMILFNWLKYHEWQLDVQSLVLMAYYTPIFFVVNGLIAIICTLLFAMPFDNLANYLTRVIFS